MKFTKAEKRQAKLRLALIGPSGSGKTYTALAIGSGLGEKIAVIDSERKSASLYADKFSYDVAELETFNPANYIALIHEAEKAGYEIIIIDGLSPAWAGKEGALELVDKEQARQQKSNSFTAWRKVTPLHNEMVDSILQSSCHIIATMRTKTEYVLEANEKGKQAPRKVCLAPIQREGMDYEFTIVCDLDLDHNLIVGKTRCDILDGKIFPKAGKDFADVLKGWLNSGAALPAPTHWIENDDTRKAFWKWVKDQGANEVAVHTALGVASIAEFKGSKAEAAKLIVQYMKDHPKSPVQAAGNGGNGTATPQTPPAPSGSPSAEPPPSSTIDMDEPIGEGQAKILKNTLVGWLRFDGGVVNRDHHNAIANRFIQLACDCENIADISRRDTQALLDRSMTLPRLLKDAEEFLKNLNAPIPKKLTYYLTPAPTPADGQLV